MEEALHQRVVSLFEPVLRVQASESPGELRAALRRVSREPDYMRTIIATGRWIIASGLSSELPLDGPYAQLAGLVPEAELRVARMRQVWCRTCALMLAQRQNTSVGEVHAAAMRALNVDGVPSPLDQLYERSTMSSVASDAIVLSRWFSFLRSMSPWMVRALGGAWVDGIEATTIVTMASVRLIVSRETPGSSLRETVCEFPPAGHELRIDESEVARAALCMSQMSMANRKIAEMVEATAPRPAVSSSRLS